MPQAARRDCGPQPRRAIAALDRRLAVSTKTLGVSIGEETGNGPYMHDAEMIAQELSLLGHKLEDVKSAWPTPKRSTGDWKTPDPVAYRFVEVRALP
jgi:hypothetical protein